MTRVGVLTGTIRFMWFFLWLMDECLVSTWLQGLDTMWHKWHEGKIPSWVLVVADWSKPAPRRGGMSFLGGVSKAHSPLRVAREGGAGM